MLNILVFIRGFQRYIFILNALPLKLDLKKVPTRNAIPQVYHMALTRWIISERFRLVKKRKEVSNKPGSLLVLEDDGVGMRVWHLFDAPTMSLVFHLQARILVKEPTNQS